jgi:hypothetical protein
MAAASKSALEDLHSALAKKLLEIVNSGEMTASLAKEIREFLKDNGIEAVATPGSPTADLADNFPFQSDNVVTFPK